MGSLFEVSDLVRTTDVDEARDQVARVFCPHRLRPVGARMSVNLRFRAARLGSIGLVHLDYGTQVTIDPRRLERFYLVQIPLDGKAVISQNDETIVSTTSLASVLSPDADVSMRWQAGNPQLIFYAERAAVEAEASRIIGRTLPGSLEFALGMRLDSPAAVAWLRAVRYLRDELVHDSPLVRESRTRAHLAQHMITQLLVAQPHSLSDTLTTAEPLTSGTVRRACDFINGHICEPMTVSDVAAAVGVSLRSLQIAFRQQLDTTPLHYIRTRRLERVHQALKRANPTQNSVAEVALACGFTHLGRFAIEYRRAFGEFPSESLTRN